MQKIYFAYFSIGYEYKVGSFPEKKGKPCIFFHSQALKQIILL